MFLSWADFTSKREAQKYVPLDCSINLKKKGLDEYKHHRIEGAHYLDMNVYFAKDNKPVAHRTPSVYEIEDQLRKLGIDKDTKVVCYDNSDGIFACRAGVLLRAFGVKHTQILNCKFGSQVNREDKEIPAHRPEKGTDFGFTLPNGIFASENEVDMICSGKSEGTQILEVKPLDKFKKEAFPKAINMHEVELFSS
jgi:thiosulfate/3-mercaptopyruvate sulfurtransferase